MNLEDLERANGIKQQIAITEKTLEKWEFTKSWWDARVALNAPPWSNGGTAPYAEPSEKILELLKAMVMAELRSRHSKLLKELAEI